jgi:hypothetical protein
MDSRDIRGPGTVIEFDLILKCPGKWILKGQALPDSGFWYSRQRNALSYANWSARGSETMIVRIHNHWSPIIA